MERKKENSSAASRDIPATCPAAIVHIEREVPGKTAESTWTAPIQIAVGRFASLHVLNFWPNEKRIDNPHHDAADEERERHDVQVLEILADQFA